MSTTQKIYIVQGSSGEYSDRSDWIVTCFSTKEAADEWAHLCTEEAAESIKAADGLYYDAKPTQHDPRAHFDYTGVTYWVEEADLHSP